MTPQDAEIIKDVFARLKAMGPASGDAEAAGFVEAQLRADRGAGLALVQALVSTDRECARLAAENQTLKQQMATQGAPRPQTQGGGLFGQPSAGVPQTGGPWDRGPQAQPPGPWGREPAPGPWGEQQAPQQGGFWSSALRTGAGVAGGLFAFEAIKGIFGGSSHGGGAGGTMAGGSGLFDQQPTTVINQTNIYEGDRLANGPGTGPSGASNADYASGGFIDDGGFDDGLDDDNFG